MLNGVSKRIPVNDFIRKCYIVWWKLKLIDNHLLSFDCKGVCVCVYVVLSIKPHDLMHDKYMIYHWAPFQPWTLYLSPGIQLWISQIIVMEACNTEFIVHLQKNVHLANWKQNFHPFVKTPCVCNHNQWKVGKVMNLKKNGEVYRRAWRKKRGGRNIVVKMQSQK